MTKPLVIVESPAKARTIGSFLGSGYDVKASIGHIRDLPRSADEVPEQYKGTDIGRLGIDIENHFQPIYIIPSEKKKVISELKQALKNANEVYLATDEDREGEAISWHVLEVLKPKVPVKRMVFHEISRHAIEDAIDNWRELDMKLVEAQEGRRILDRLVGYEVSPVLWKKVMPRLSAGRVQSVATRLVVERELARMAFVGGNWWDLEAVFAADSSTFDARLLSVNDKKIPAGKDFDPATGRPSAPEEILLLDENDAQALTQRLSDSDFRVVSVETSPWKQQPHAPFITSTLQQEAGRKLRYAASRTMQIAQRLYEQGYITYMRTDSTNLSEDATRALRDQIQDKYGAQYVPERARTYARKVKNAQEAHEAIRPAGDVIRVPDQVRQELDTDAFRLYELIWMRTIASQMMDARGQRVSARIGATSSDGEKVLFAASGRTIEFPGYLRAYVEGADDPDAELEDRETPIPALAEGQGVECRELQPSGHNTQPPARYTEASLVKELEERGIGRPSTYASIIQTIEDRGYVWKKGSALVPSWMAFAVVRLLEEHFGHLVDYGFTARMEGDLDQIAAGEGESEKWLHSFYFGNGMVGLKQLINDDKIAEIDARALNSISLGNDDQGREVIVRVGRYGPYVQRGDDRASIPEDIAPDELTIAMCEDFLIRGQDEGRVLGMDPETGKEIVAKDGRYGPYVQLGEIEEEGKKKKKPKTASLFKSMEVATVTLEQALQLLSQPRVVGSDAEGSEITAQNGRFGPYIKKGTDSRSLTSEDEIFTITVEEAEKIFAQPKRGRGRQAKPPLAELGAHPDSGEPIKLLDGRYGPYVTDGTTNASIPRGSDPASITLDDAVALLRARAEMGPAKKRKAVRKKKK